MQVKSNTAAGQTGHLLEGEENKARVGHQMPLRQRIIGSTVREGMGRNDWLVLTAFPCLWSATSQLFIPEHRKSITEQYLPYYA